MDSRFKTAKGPGVGSSFGQLRKTEKQLSFGSAEGVIGVSAQDLNMTFSLAIDSATESASSTGTVRIGDGIFVKNPRRDQDQICLDLRKPKAQRAATLKQRSWPVYQTPQGVRHPFFIFVR